MPAFCAHALSLQWGEYFDSCLHRGVGSSVAFYSTCKKKSAIFYVKYCSSNNSYLWKGEIEEQLCGVLTVLYKTEGCLNSEGYFYFVSQLNFQNLQSDNFDFVVKQSGTPYK